MRKLAVVALSATLLLAPLASDAHAAGPKRGKSRPEKVGVCHDAQEDGSYVFIRVSAHAQGHDKHAEDIVGVVGPEACES